mgnify:CR=1 FL=1
MNYRKVAEGVRWEKFCSLLDKIKAAKIKQKKKELLQDFMESYRVTLQQQKCNHPNSVSAFVMHLVEEFD